MTMTKPQHTPGAWKAYNDDDLQYFVETADGRSICEISGNTSFDMVNAHLIAAAPDLYDAVAAARKYLCDENREADDLLPVIEALGAAIAKAKGEA